ncbi:acyl-CoA N-acyltransferase [Xylariales sp. PMI_506]|nr:acyl-CoA N-acyltransferase [Xylariales sp. PMI_506]
MLRIRSTAASFRSSARSSLIAFARQHSLVSDFPGPAIRSATLAVCRATTTRSLHIAAIRFSNNSNSKSPAVPEESSMSAAKEFQVSKLTAADFNEWSALFRAYIDFYETTIPDEQYPKTFKRLLDEQSDLHALVLRQGGSDGKMVGIAHFLPQQSPWSEQNVMLLNDLFIDPALRGGGLGRKMIQAVADVSKELGCSRLQWVTKHDNVTARKLYDTMAVAPFVQYRMSLS